MGFFKKLFGKNTDDFYAPMAGKAVAITEVPDPTFAEGMLGNGIAIEPTEGKVYAPCDATVDMMFDAPVCNATEFNYFKYYQYYTDTYDFDAVASVFNAQRDEGAVHVQFGSLVEVGKAYKDLIENGQYKKISAVKNAKSYIYNESHYTFTFILGT